MNILYLHHYNDQNAVTSPSLAKMRGLKMLQNQPHTILVYLTELLDLAKNETWPESKFS